MRTSSTTETRFLGEQLSKLLRSGDVLLLLGDMGAGKSEFTRGIARGLGITSPVASPTFTILQVYDEGRIPLYHFDWYRLNSAEELFEMGMEEYLGGDGIAVVEWPNRCPEAIPESRLEVTILPVDENVREITWESKGDFRIIREEEVSA